MPTDPRDRRCHLAAVEDYAAHFDELYASWLANRGVTELELGKLELSETELRALAKFAGEHRLGRTFETDCDPGDEN